MEEAEKDADEDSDEALDTNIVGKGYTTVSSANPKGERQRSQTAYAKQKTNENAPYQSSGSSGGGKPVESLLSTSSREASTPHPTNQNQDEDRADGGVAARWLRQTFSFVRTPTLPRFATTDRSRSLSSI